MPDKSRRKTLPLIMMMTTIMMIIMMKVTIMKVVMLTKMLRKRPLGVLEG